ncbi:hypothetical protein KJ853_02790 [Patescibacteria group bacterium]|nr:hypothetical protein [Patescibacteria group bacterium]
MKKLEFPDFVEFKPPLTGILRQTGQKVKITGYFPSYPPKFQYEENGTRGKAATAEKLEVDEEQIFISQSFPAKPVIEKTGPRLSDQMQKKIERALNQEQEKVEQELDATQKNLRKQLKDFPKISTTHLADSAPDASPAALLNQKIQNCKKRLWKINMARLRLRIGLYGLCKHCREKISLSRLEKIPFADTCAKCKQSHHFSYNRSYNKN